MRGAPSSSMTRLTLPATLLVGVGGAVLMFGLQRRAPRTVEGEAPPVAASAAAAAHAAARISTVPGSAAPGFEERLHVLRARVAAAPESRESVVELARFLHDGHGTREAIEYYRKAIELDPTRAEGWYDLATAHAELAEWDQAADVLLDRLEQDPGDAVARYDLAAVRANQGRTKEAKALFEESLVTTTDGALRARISEALARLKGA